MEKIKYIYNKKKEIINYLIFGVLTTLVNFIVYYVSVYIIKDKNISNIIAWIVSVLFAYITNKLYVFESKELTVNVIKNELLKFFGCRIFSGILDVVMFFVMVTLCNINDFITKCLIAIFVVILNYIFSKVFIFKNKKEENING